MGLFLVFLLRLSISASFLMFFDIFSVRARNLQHCSKTLVFTMSLNDLTMQRNIYFHNFHNVFRYQMWHSCLIGFGIDFGPIWHPVGIKLCDVIVFYCFGELYFYKF